jgi:hypothetical protein
MLHYLRHRRARWSAFAIGALTGIVAIGLIVAAGTADQAVSPAVAESAPPADGSSTSQVTTTPGSAGMWAAIDPETGDLIPVPAGTVTKARDAELARMLSRSTDGLEEVVLPDGSVMVDLQGRFMNASVATIDENGELQTSCVDDADEALHLLGCPHQDTAATPATGGQGRTRTVEVK